MFCIARNHMEDGVRKLRINDWKRILRPDEIAPEVRTTESLLAGTVCLSLPAEQDIDVLVADVP